MFSAIYCLSISYLVISFLAILALLLILKYDYNMVPIKYKRRI